jgi:hypothetical protein
MTEQDEQHGTADVWLTIAEAARHLEVSDRQARRYAKKLAADDRREGGHEAEGEGGHEAEGEGGHMTGAGPALVRLEAMKVIRAQIILRSGRPGAKSDTWQAHVGQVTEQQAKEGGHHDGHAPNPATGAPPELVEHLKTENTFLRAQLEEATRGQAELRQAVRELTRTLGHIKALPAPDSAPQNTPAAPQQAPTPAPSKDATTRRRARPLWQVMLGIRPRGEK